MTYRTAEIGGVVHVIEVDDCGFHTPFCWQGPASVKFAWLGTLRDVPTCLICAAWWMP